MGTTSRALNAYIAQHSYDEPAPQSARVGVVNAGHFEHRAHAAKGMEYAWDHKPSYSNVACLPLANQVPEPSWPSWGARYGESDSRAGSVSGRGEEPPPRGRISYQQQQQLQYHNARKAQQQQQAAQQQAQQQQQERPRNELAPNVQMVPPTALPAAMPMQQRAAPNQRPSQQLQQHQQQPPPAQQRPPAPPTPPPQEPPARRAAAPSASAAAAAPAAAAVASADAPLARLGPKEEAGKARVKSWLKEQDALLAAKVEQMRRDQKRDPPLPPQQAEPPPVAPPDESRWAMQRRGGAVPAGANRKRPNELPVPPQYHEPQHPRYPHQHYPVPTRQGPPPHPRPQQPVEPTPGSLRGLERMAGAGSQPAAAYYQQAHPPPPPEPRRADALPLAEPMAVARAYPYPPGPPVVGVPVPAQRGASPIRVQQRATSALTLQVARRAAGAEKPKKAAGDHLKPTDGVPVAFAVALPVAEQTTLRPRSAAPEAPPRRAVSFARPPRERSPPPAGWYDSDGNWHGEQPRRPSSAVRGNRRVDSAYGGPPSPPSFYGARAPASAAHHRYYGADPSDELNLAGYGAGLAMGGRHPFDGAMGGGRTGGGRGASATPVRFMEAPAMAPSIPVAAPMLRRGFY